MLSKLVRQLIFFYWPLGDGAPWATTLYRIVTWTRQVFLIFHGRTSRNLSHINKYTYVTGCNQCGHFLSSINQFRYSLLSSVVFYTSLATLQGGLYCPSCDGCAGTSLPRRQSQQVGLDRSNNLGILNLL